MSSSVPVANRPETIIATAITIQVVAIISVLLRLYARYSVVRGLGYDDLLVTLACVRLPQRVTISLVCRADKKINTDFDINWNLFCLLA